MAEGKRKFIEDAARVIDGRVAELKWEYAREAAKRSDISNAADRAAIAEAEHCARLIRCLLRRPYRGNHVLVQIRPTQSDRDLPR